MDIPELKAFVSVTHHRSFSKAAAALHMSQPAISRRIQSLESSLQQTLFDRDGHTIHLTAAGSLLLPSARQILELVAQTQTKVSSIGDEVQGPLTLAISHHFAKHYLARPLAKFAAQYPKVELFFEFVASEAACDRVIQGEVDIGLVTLPPKGLYPKLRMAQLHLESLHIMVNQAHQLAQQKIMSISDLCQYQALLPPLKSFTGQHLLQSLQTTAANFKTIIECSDFSSLKALLMSGLGWGLLPDPLYCDSLVKIQVSPQAIISRSLGLIAHQNRQSSPAIVAFEQILTSL